MYRTLDVHYVASPMAGATTATITATAEFTSDAAAIGALLGPSPFTSSLKQLRCAIHRRLGVAPGEQVLLVREVQGPAAARVRAPRMFEIPPTEDGGRTIASLAVSPRCCDILVRRFVPCDDGRRAISSLRPYTAHAFTAHDLVERNSLLDALKRDFSPEPRPAHATVFVNLNTPPPPPRSAAESIQADSCAGGGTKYRASTECNDENAPPSAAAACVEASPLKRPRNETRRDEKELECSPRKLHRVGAARREDAVPWLSHCSVQPGAMQPIRDASSSDDDERFDTAAIRSRIAIIEAAVRR
jgi:hypothetical protein